MTNDPRKNAPARICDLPRDELMPHLYARDKRRRDAYMDRFRAPPEPSLLGRLVARLRA